MVLSWTRLSCRLWFICFWKLPRTRFLRLKKIKLNFLDRYIKRNKATVKSGNNFLGRSACGLIEPSCSFLYRLSTAASILYWERVCVAYIRWYLECLWLFRCFRSRFLKPHYKCDCNFLDIIVISQIVDILENQKKINYALRQFLNSAWLQLHKLVSYNKFLH